MNYNDLASYAVQVSQGRLYEVDKNTVEVSFPTNIRTRTDFQKDRDRIIHSTAFRRLAYKTQVFLNDSGSDLCRNRLTHSLEVAQIARTIAYALHLNVDLVEAISLAHDLGHAPFGHSGQDILNSCLKKQGSNGFEHNIQALRMVDKLEKRYGYCDGLNLCFETREGLLKHCSQKSLADIPVDLSYRFIHKLSPSLEAQVADVADEIAYNHHDLDDGMRAGLVDINVVAAELPFVATIISTIKKQYLGIDLHLMRKILVSQLLNETVNSVVVSSANYIQEAQVASVNEVRQCAKLIKYNDDMWQQQKALKRFLMANLYRHPQVMAVRTKNTALIANIFDFLVNNPQNLPLAYHDRYKSNKLRTVADYIAGMTDRFALNFFNQ